MVSVEPEPTARRRAVGAGRLMRTRSCDSIPRAAADRNGIDDGTTTRNLTTEVLAPLLTGAHRPSALSVAVSRLLPPTR